MSRSSRLSIRQDSPRSPVGSTCIFVALLCLLFPVRGVDGQIQIGENIQISESRSQISHFELLGAADPENPDHLMACSIFYPPPPDEMATIVYASFDGGRSWKPTLDEKRLGNSGDPICAYGPDDVAYYVVLTLGTEDDSRRATEIYRSTDGGRTWAEPVIMPFIDREFALVDNTDSEYRGSIYINGTFFFDSMRPEDENATGLALTYSRDGFHFEPPVTRLAGGNRYILGMGNSVAFSDGTLLFVTDVLEDYHKPDGSRRIDPPAPGNPNGVLEVLHSYDGGRTLSGATKVADLYQPSPYHGTSINPYLAVDLSSGPFQDRAYLVWPDQRSGRVDIMFSSSADKGRTWSHPRVINDDRFPAHPAEAPDHLMPVVGVNREGVVGVVWYDRRDNPEGLGWHVRFSASLDGGDTWLPSQRVSDGSSSFGDFSHFALQARVQGGAPEPQTDRPSGGIEARSGGHPLTVNVGVRGFTFQGGHYSGLAVAADGVFHPTWVDNRTGISQIWTAPIRVEGTGARHGGGELSAMVDVSSRVNLKLTDLTFDPLSGIMTLAAHLKNASKDTIQGPVKARVIQLQSQLGVPELIDAENDLPGTGAVLDFSHVIRENSLEPGAESGEVQIRIRISDVRMLKEADDPSGLLSLEVRILASPLNSS